MSVWGRTKNLGRMLLSAVKGWIAHRATSRGAALAFYTLLSMAPLLVLVTAVAGQFLGPQAAEGVLYVQLERLVGPAGAVGIQTLLAGTQVPGSGRLASAFAAVVLVFASTSVFVELKDSLDEIWQTPETAPAGLVVVLRGRVVSFGLILFLAFLLITSLAINGALGILGRALENRWLGSLPLLATLSSLFGFLVLMGLFAVIYKMLPEVKLSWKDAAVGALSTALLFSLGKYFVGLYLLKAAVSSTYGATGAVAALMIWVYYSAQIFFLGAEITREYALTFGSLRLDKE